MIIAGIVISDVITGVKSSSVTVVALAVVVAAAFTNIVIHPASPKALFVVSLRIQVCSPFIFNTPFSFMLDYASRN